MSAPFALLPEPFGWVEIPAGSVALEGSRRVSLPAFAISRYPVTNAQYQVFAGVADGYCDPFWWNFSVDAVAWRAASANPPETAHPGADLPRTNVNWYEAVAFSRWLSARTGQTITLPTEAQWQRAAVGETGFAYPWGNSFDPARCNFRSEAPTPVTAYPGGASPLGVWDLSGNVWEWCATDYETWSDDLTHAAPLRTLRGGSWWTWSADDLRADYRTAGYPDGWSHDWGFRLVRQP